MRILVDMIDTIGIERACSPDESVNLIAFVQQEFCQIRAVLAGDASDKCSFHSVSLGFNQSL